MPVDLFQVGMWQIMAYKKQPIRRYEYGYKGSCAPYYIYMRGSAI